MYIRMKLSKHKKDSSGSPYDSYFLEQPWLSGISHIPRARTKWNTNPTVINESARSRTAKANESVSYRNDLPVITAD